MQNLNNLQKLLNKNVISDNDAQTLTKIFLARDVAPAGMITARYEMTISSEDKNGKQSMMRQYKAQKLGAIEKASHADSFIIYTKIGYKLPAIIDAVKLSDTFKKAPIFTPCIVDAYNAQQEANKGAWIGQLKDAAKDKDGTKAAQIIRTILRPDFITSKGEMIGIDWRFKEHHNTITKLLDNIGIAPHQNKEFLNDTLIKSHAHFIAGYAVRLITDPREVSQIYAQNDDFTSCMKGLEAPAQIYTHYTTNSEGEPVQSVGLYVLEKEGEFIARFIGRLKNGKYPTIYTDWQTSTIENVLDALGHERNPSCFYGARLPLITDESNQIVMPYLDGDNKEIRLIEGETGAFLQVGGTKGEQVGEANGTKGFLRLNNHAYQLGYREGHSKKYSIFYNGDDEDDNENRFYCSHCNEYCDDDQHNTVNDESVCDYCLNNDFTTCEDCEEYTLSDDANFIEVYNHQSDETESITLCECCLSDNYYLEPVKNEYYFNIASLKRYVLG